MRKNRFLRVLGTLSYILLLVGAINWALVGIFGFDLVAYLFGEMTWLTRAVYIAVGASAILSLISMMFCNDSCECSIS
ncbi:DUF378 domain-containing protein [bacterium]|nr:DUF378 domain-containing protein [bacterium]